MEVLAVISEEVFNKLPKELVREFTNIRYQEVNEYENNKEDEVYNQLYKDYKKARDKKNEYLFNKRHK